ncbi:uncharacterized protein LOC116286797 [Actinia tenebrosa]|uniref:Uncharacterized protein LOC116286797 n=1 Tax=Actinia tenebrosa TaxID=6105 RepID=A0A6P8H8Z9_ACTTE|nr:uncharacterized protein LOC116286797 [Actinia tenebrosa]
MKTPKGRCKKGIIDAVKSKVYKSRQEFKYSTRVICTYAISLIILFEVGIRLVILGLPKNHYLLFYLYPIITKITMAMLAFGWNPMLAKWTLIMRVSWFTAITISTAYYIIATINMMSLHRSHLRRLQRGDKSLLPKKIQKESPSFMTVSILSCNDSI